MCPPAPKRLDTEQERQHRLEEMQTDHEQYRPGSFGCHELLDRTSLAADIVDRYVLSHPACIQNQEWFALAEKAADALQELYQRVGEVHLDEECTGNADP